MQCLIHIGVKGKNKIISSAFGAGVSFMTDNGVKIYTLVILLLIQVHVVFVWIYYSVFCFHRSHSTTTSFAFGKNTNEICVPIKKESCLFILSYK